MLSQNIDGTHPDSLDSGILSLVRESHVGSTGIGQTVIKVVGLLSGTTSGISRVVAPEDNCLSVVLLDVVGSLLIDVSIRWAKEFGFDSENLDKGFVETLEFVVDLGVAERGD